MKSLTLLSATAVAVTSLGNAMVIAGREAAISPAVSVNPAAKFIRSGDAPPRVLLQGQSPVKRAGFDAGGNDNWCGETDPWYDYSAAAPDSSDCAKLAPWWDYTSDGFWALQPSDFSASTGWAKIHTIGTCSIAVKFQVASDTTTANFGTNDVHFFITQVLPYAQNGKLGAQGTTSCSNGHQLNDLLWGLIHS